MNLFRLLITFMFIQSNASFLDSFQSRNYKTPRIVVKNNNSRYVNTPNYLRKRKNNFNVDKSTVYSQPIYESKRTDFPTMSLIDSRIISRIILGTIYSFIVIFSFIKKPPKPPDEPPQIKSKYNFNFTPIWSPVNASLTTEQADILYKVSIFSWTVFLFYFVNLKF